MTSQDAVTAIAAAALSQAVPSPDPVVEATASPPPTASGSTSRESTPQPSPSLSLPATQSLPQSLLDSGSSVPLLPPSTPVPSRPLRPSRQPQASQLLSISSASIGTAEKRKATRFVWQTDMTIHFLELLRVAQNDEKLNSAKTAELKLVMTPMLSDLRASFPHAAWDVNKLLNAYRNLQARHRMFLWMTQKSGVTYDPASGIVNASDEQWEAYSLQFGKKGTWLKNLGLPRPDLYDEVYRSNRPVGLLVSEVLDDQGSHVDLTQGWKSIDQSI
ncbi:hypothetical protein EDB80DRAFT_317921 [Ilyonectria destructans]|nr:hypothetical protein EDB80DRAFT_317921 [Ilyonectria destructans]